ncbi:DNA starvation/stationary phase protection protein [Fulvitalea axinellae]|uniref:DNA starvation/stationary phase protection protein n=1 Tax=Fulvitalea axinellae TaxID=1182444 RepID=A0AAU9CGC0_9BACT|nr:DNA starvation/stationary phase protection protein [Fulvitalea axinellae]
MKKTNIGMLPEHRKEVAMLLNTVLADEFALYIKTKKYHWNMGGMEFISLHKFLDELAEQQLELIDEIAERNLHIGEYAIGSLSAFQKLTNMVEDDEAKDVKEMIANLVNDHETLIRYLRAHADEVLDKYKDAGTNDYFIQWMEAHEKIAWMLRAHLS